MEEKLKFAVFIDYDNIEIGVKSTLGRELDMACVLEGVLQRGEIVSKIAYGNWSHHPEATRSFAEFGIQMVQRDSTPRGDKNGGDINLALDALEMAFIRDHINAFAIVSGDSDFMALVNKLKEYNKRVYVVGGKQFTSTILQRNCHEFISYESLLDLLPRRRTRPSASGAPPPRQPQRKSLPLEQAVALLDRALSALEIRGAQPQLGLLKSTMLQLDPAFTERDYGFGAFSQLMEKLEEQKLIKVVTVDQHLVVQRDAAVSTTPAQRSLHEREEALPFLQETLIAYVDLLEMGIPEREVEALMRASDPEFNESDFGFQEFGEMLNLGVDKGLLRVEADSTETLRYYPGNDLHELLPVGPPARKKAAAPARRESGRPASAGRRESARPVAPAASSAPSREPAQDDDGGEGGDGAQRRSRRRRRRRGGRGRGEGARMAASPDGPAGPFPDDGDEGDEFEAAPPTAGPIEVDGPPEPDFDRFDDEEPEAEHPATVAEEDAEAAAAPAPKKAARKKAAKKKAARKKAAKKKTGDDEE